jgi:hypothetical protein
MALGGAPQPGQRGPDNNRRENKNKGPKSGGPVTTDYTGKFSQKLSKFYKDAELAEQTFYNEVKAGNPLAKENFANKINELLTQGDGLYLFLESGLNEAQNTINQNNNTNQDQKQKDINGINALKKTVSDALEKIKKSYHLDHESRLKEAEDMSPESLKKKNQEKLKGIQSAVGQVYRDLIALIKKIEDKAHHGGLSDSDKELFETDVSELMVRYSVAVADLRAMANKGEQDKFKIDVNDPVQTRLIEEILKIRSRIQDVGPVTETLEEFKNSNDQDANQGQLLEKIEGLLSHGLDTFAGAREHINHEMDNVQNDLFTLHTDLTRALEKDKKLDPADKPPFENRVSALDSQIEIVFEESIEAQVNIGAHVTDKQQAQIAELTRRGVFLRDFAVSLREKIDGRPEAKDQRKNAREISDRIGALEKQIKDEGDAREIGKAFDESQKATFRIMIDTEVIAVRDAQDELDHLPDTPENEPTRTMIRSILEKAEDRLRKAEEKVDAKRVAKEKEVKEKLDAIEEAIEKVEDRIREIKAAEANSKLQFKERKAEAMEKAGWIQKLWTPFAKYESGLTYHDQKNVNESMRDPRDDINKVKEWIADMPESNEKERKLKVKLERKTRRMMRRRRSAMIRHFMALNTKQKGKFIFNKTFEAASDAVMDNVFGRAE